MSLRFEKDLSCSLLLNFLGATCGVREGLALTLTLHLHRSWASVTWRGSAGHSNPSSSDFPMGWCYLPRVRILSLTRH